MVSTTWRCVLQMGMPYRLVLNAGMYLHTLMQPNFLMKKSIYACSQINARFIWLLVKFSVYLRVNLKAKI